jgi:hypothetical protein
MPANAGKSSKNTAFYRLIPRRELKSKRVFCSFKNCFLHIFWLFYKNNPAYAAPVDLKNH